VHNHRKLTSNTEAVEVRLFAALDPGQPVPMIRTLTIPAGEIVEFSAEEDKADSVRVGWQGKIWVIDKADWNVAERITS
jgi:hypothetical protein